MGAISGGVIAVWGALQLSASPTLVAGIVLAAGLVGGGLARRMLSAPTGVLRFDGTRWWWQPSFANALGKDDHGTPGSLTVVIDLGRWLLAKFDDAPSAGSAGTVWVPLSARAGGDAWRGWRAVIHSRRASGPHGEERDPEGET